jgi:hypothetical protein
MVFSARQLKKSGCGMEIIIEREVMVVHINV